MIQKIYQFIIILFKNPFLPFSKIVCILRSAYYTTLIDEGKGKIVITKPFLKVKIIKCEGAKLIIKGNLSIIPHVGGSTPVYISMGINSQLNIESDFVIGQGVRIFLHKNATLFFGGKFKETGSGITADTLIMVNKHIEIGKDFLCAWNVFISDSDWHQIENQSHQKDVKIGDHVWIANSCSIIKGSIIGNNTIVASHTKVTHGNFPDNVLLAGMPAKVVKNNITWSRDID